MDVMNLERQVKIAKTKQQVNEKLCKIISGFKTTLDSTNSLTPNHHPGKNIYKNYLVRIINCIIFAK
jgi:hypothetical protein